MGLGLQHIFWEDSSQPTTMSKTWRPGFESESWSLSNHVSYESPRCKWLKTQLVYRLQQAEEMVFFSLLQPPLSKWDLACHKWGTWEEALGPEAWERVLGKMSDPRASAFTERACWDFGSIEIHQRHQASLCLIPDTVLSQFLAWGLGPGEHPNAVSLVSR